MTCKLIFPAIFVSAILFSCMNNGTSPKLPTAQQLSRKTVQLDSTFQSCDSVFIATYPGTACCVSGPIVAKPGDIFRYHYQTNHSDPHITWQIQEGDISIIAGQSTLTVTVQFGPRFKNGVIIGDGDGISPIGGARLRCANRAVVTGN